MTHPASPYLIPGFYDRALAAGRHREITGGWWEETGRIQLDLLRAEGMRADHRLLDIGAGALRLGRQAVPFLDAGNYWATDASGALMARGHDVELVAKHRLPSSQLIEDAGFAFPGVPATIDFAIAFAVFTHLPARHLAPALSRIHTRFPALQKLLFTVFLASDGHTGALRQPHGAVSHPDRPPYHRPAVDVLADAIAAGFTATFRAARLPRGQVLCLAQPA